MVDLYLIIFITKNQPPQQFSKAENTISRVVGSSTFWCAKLVRFSNERNLSEVASYSPPLKLCTACHGAKIVEIALDNSRYLTMLNK